LAAKIVTVYQFYTLDADEPVQTLQLPVKFKYLAQFALTLHVHGHTVQLIGLNLLAGGNHLLGQIMLAHQIGYLL
jgi:hypothetical protein